MNRFRLARLTGCLLALASCGGTGAGAPTRPAPEPGPGEAVAIFAGGCFWCMEGPFEALDGVKEVLSGYTGGTEAGPTYAQVSARRTGHREAVWVRYDPEAVSYDRLLEVFWRNVDPFQDDGQFCDHGPQYRAAIFVLDEAQRASAERSREAVAARFGRPVATEILPAGTFWVAEAWHQDFHRTHPERYQRYRAGCGRDRRLVEIWGPEAGGGTLRGAGRSQEAGGR